MKKTKALRLTTKQRTKLKSLTTQNVFLMHDLFRFAVLPAVREHHTRLATDGGKSADAAAKQLITTARPHDLKVQCLVKLAQLLGPKTNAQPHCIIGRNDPAVADELRGAGHRCSFTARGRNRKSGWKFIT